MQRLILAIDIWQAFLIQMKNLLGDKAYKNIQNYLDKALNMELPKLKNHFQSGITYVKKWNYLVN